MVNCPACSQEVNEDFGMVTCPHCKAVFMIDYSGNIQYGTSEPEEDFNDSDESDEFDADDETPLTSEVTLENNSFNDDLNAETPEDEFNETEEAENLEDFTSEGSFYDNEINSQSDDFSEDQEEDFSEEEDAFAEDEESDFESEAESEPSQFPSGFSSEVDDSIEEPASAYSDEESVSTFTPPPPLAPDHKPVDVSGFANSEASLLEGGEFRYTIKVSRIDSKDLRNSLKYVLMDEKLKLNYNEYIKNIVDGSVTIPDLHPIKAKRIVEQLQFFDLEVQWQQKRVIMEEPTVEAEGGEDFLEE